MTDSRAGRKARGEFHQSQQRALGAAGAFGCGPIPRVKVLKEAHIKKAVSGPTRDVR